MLNKAFDELERCNLTWRRPKLDDVYHKLRVDLESYYWNIATATNTPFSDSHACPNDEDMKFLSEQRWLGGSKDATLRFASLVNATCGGRVREGFYMFKTSLFPVYTHEIGWNSMALRWLREKNHMMSCLLLVPHAYLYV